VLALARGRDPLEDTLVRIDDQRARGTGLPLALGRARRPRIHQAERAPGREAGVDKDRKRQSETLGDRKVGGRRLGRDCE
jgi:hypothetical protein